MRRAACFIAAIVISGCNDVTAPQLTGASLQVSNLRWFLELGDSARFEAIVRDASGSVVPLKVTWSSTNPSVVTVDETGLAVARAVGSATISVSANGVGSTGWQLGVVRPIAALAIHPDSVVLIPGNKTIFSASPVDTSGSPVTADQSLVHEMASDVTWSLGDAAVARLGPDSAVSAPSLVTALRAGRTFIKGDLHGHSGTASATVKWLEITQPVAGGSFTCALGTDSLPYCWGNGADVLRDDSASGWWTPPYVAHSWPDAPRLASISAGGRHVCGLTRDGVAYCWGSNEWGALGIGTAEQPTGPALVSGSLRFSTISAGSVFTCGLDVNGQVYCWGVAPGIDSTMLKDSCGGGGKAGRGYPCTYAPVPVGDGSVRFTSLSAGRDQACGLDDQGRAYCWGSFASQIPAPTLVDSTLAFSSVASGDGFNCGLAGAGSAYCWGVIPGESTVVANTPIPVAEGITFTALSGGRPEFQTQRSGHMCGVSSDGTAYCWGSNASGELGAPPSAPQFTPVKVAAQAAFTSISAGASHSCGLSASGVAYCWGGNWYGQLGTAGPDQRWTPAPVSGQRP